MSGHPVKATGNLSRTAGALQRCDMNRVVNSLRRENGTPHTQPIRMLRLAQVIDTTGLGKTTIYELQAEGDFPMRVKITSHSVGWVEEEVQAWLARRIEGHGPTAAK
jgi:prophage regulatory protein